MLKWLFWALLVFTSIFVSASVNLGFMAIRTFGISRTPGIAMFPFSFWRLSAAILVMALVIAIVCLLFGWFHRWITFFE